MLVSDLAFRGGPERLGSVTTADILVVGSGPAGASAALLLARCRRSVVICDDGKPRNAASSRIHGLIPAADLTPATFREATRRCLSSYGEITCHAERVSRIEKQGSRFTYETHTGGTGSARSVLLATGLVDTLPSLPGIEQFYGHTVHLCPYCDGYEYSDKHIVTYGKGEDGINLSLMLLLWSPHVTFCSDGEDLDAMRRTHLESKGIRLEQRRITA